MAGRPSINNDEDVLKGLQPHPKLEFLEIRNFMGNKFPSWMMTSLFPAMRTLTIDNAKNLIEWMEAATSLTEVVVFPCLEELFLRKCDQLRSVPSHFPSLQKLEIDSMDSSKPMENISKKLTTLTSLTSLTIENVRGLASLPEVMLKNNQNLANLEIRDCGKLSCIAPHVFGCCASLESLCVSKCHNIRSLPDGLHTLSLKELIVDNCPRLEFIPVTHALTSLLKLSVKYCRSLKSVPTLHGFASLHQLEIEGFHGTSPLIGLESCTSLHSLRIYGCECLTHLPNGLKILVSLEELTISRCPSLQTIPSLDNLAHLRELKISFCAGLKSLPRGLASPHCLTSLRELEIGRFSMVLHSFPTFQVSQLERLSLWGWPKLKSLPELAQHFTSLTCLEILSFDGMEALPEWLRNLASLEYLRIIWCANLMYLPTVEAVQCLTKLKEIYISGCPLLKERCNKESSAEWPKISHIPKITGTIFSSDLKSTTPDVSLTIHLT